MQVITSYAVRRLAEGMILLGVSLVIVGLRTYARATVVGMKNFKADDYIVLVALCLVVFEHVAFCILTSPWQGLGNDMNCQERHDLTPHTAEYRARLRESKILLAYFICYFIIFWLMKAATLSFISRLTHRLGKYRKRIRFGFFLVAITSVAALLCIFLSCRPLCKYWQLDPDPGANCHPATSPVNNYVMLSLNVSTYMYGTHLFLSPNYLSSDILIIAIAIVRCTLVTSDREDGAEKSHQWTIRAVFVSTVTTNLPLLYPLLRRWTATVLRFFNWKYDKDDNMRELRTITVVEEGRSETTNCNEAEVIKEEDRCPPDLEYYSTASSGIPDPKAISKEPEMNIP
ncbi:hypothetical protein F5Y18DRAFT_422475 [Xylariaceae sp. FL1019]|nr:hypothetical protein F5Y18DRAFT_422475 [Xylariaceae sp. FL1019]